MIFVFDDFVWLITEAEKYDNVQLHFDHKLVSCDFNTGEIVFHE